ncbi:MAG: hypothetical protein K2Q14_00260 [Gammaproteobacteria bacterium]|nr:hypothetical protein [Gammaproteobacteria bacterium]
MRQELSDDVNEQGCHTHQKKKSYLSLLFCCTPEAPAICSTIRKKWHAFIQLEYSIFSMVASSFIGGFASAGAGASFWWSGELAMKGGFYGTNLISQALLNRNFLPNITQSVLNWTNEPPEGFQIAFGSALLAVVALVIYAKFKCNLPKLLKLSLQFNKKTSEKLLIQSIFRTLDRIDTKLGYLIGFEKRDAYFKTDKPIDLQHELRFLLAELDEHMKKLCKKNTNKAEFLKLEIVIDAYKDAIKNASHSSRIQHLKNNFCHIYEKTLTFIIDKLASFSSIPLVTIIATLSTYERLSRWFSTPISVAVSTAVLVCTFVMQYSFYNDSLDVRNAGNQTTFPMKIKAKAFGLACVSFLSIMLAESASFISLVVKDFSQYLPPIILNLILAIALILLVLQAIKAATYTLRKGQPYLYKSKLSPDLYLLLLPKNYEYEIDTIEKIESDLIVLKYNSAMLPINTSWSPLINNAGMQIRWKPKNTFFTRDLPLENLAAELLAEFDEERPRVIENNSELIEPIAAFCQVAAESKVSNFISNVGEKITDVANTASALINVGNIFAGLTFLFLVVIWTDPTLLGLAVITGVILLIVVAIFKASVVIRNARYSNDISLTAQEERITEINATVMLKKMQQTKEPSTYNALSRSSVLNPFTLESESPQLNRNHLFNNRERQPSPSYSINNIYPQYMPM